MILSPESFALIKKKKKTFGTQIETSIYMKDRLQLQIHRFLIQYTFASCQKNEDRRINKDSTDFKALSSNTYINNKINTLQVKISNSNNLNQTLVSFSYFHFSF